MLNYDPHHGSPDAEWRKGKDYGSRKLVGIEFEYEVQKGTRKDVLTDVDKYVNDKTKSENFFVAERDGSLNEETGIEFISNPIPYTEVLGKASIVRSLIQVLAEHAPKPQRQAVGIHVNVNAKAYSADERSAIVWFFKMLRPLGILVAGRETDRYATYQPLPIGTVTNKYHAAVNHQKGGRIEVRIHHSTVDELMVQRRVLYSISGSECAAKYATKIKELAQSKKGLDEIASQLYEWYISFLKGKTGKMHQELLGWITSEFNPKTAFTKGMKYFKEWEAFVNNGGRAAGPFVPREPTTGEREEIDGFIRRLPTVAVRRFAIAVDVGMLRLGFGHLTRRSAVIQFDTSHPEVLESRMDAYRGFLAAQDRMRSLNGAVTVDVLLNDPVVDDRAARMEAEFPA